MEECAIYLYSIVPYDYIIPLDILGMDNINNLYYIEHEDIKAIVSKVPLEDFSEEAFAQNVENMEWLKQKAILHSNIINQLFSKASSFIPVKFGTIYLCEESAYIFLRDNYQIMKEALQKVKEKEEWGIKLYCDLNKFIETEMVNEKKSVLEQTSNISKGAQYFLQKKLSGTIENMAKSKVFTISQKIFDEFSASYFEGKLNKILSKEATGRSLDMYMNSVFLIHKDNVVKFKQTAENYKNDYRSIGINIELIGPWPPYNFCSI